ncbi:DUF1405 domain-containing protein [Listeria booriae]|uniref:DUF1405 domain-containing protein n=1 Tax=Listeria booriae TaxID=1552123 RepID=UPI00162A1020|nr:DUF1405 domain-containing protein [Listeria booriae]MBC1512786.1 DUF1405 domain-containing protein [Listeria booriae]MBC6151753.1 DUF1405 domain-containing protein [Listeria booriae]MBC6306672.1 DUF1405 domain-containing protein [Listeria booriae]
MYRYLANRSFLRLLFIVNLLGAVYGFIWYLPQLEITEPRFWLFVPDSPTAVLFFVFVLMAWLAKKHWPLMEALAFVCLLKYGLWAVGMNLAYMIDLGHLDMLSLMLLVSHGLMAIQAFVYAPFYRIRFQHFAIATIWTLHNDVIDYLFGQMPIYGGLDQYITVIGYCTFWLTMFVLWTVYEKTLKNTAFKLEFPHEA